jgi:hypothetical protein
VDIKGKHVLNHTPQPLSLFLLLLLLLLLLPTGCGVVLPDLD